jgi:hypothetical protein
LLLIWYEGHRREELHVRHGITIPPFAEFADVRALADLAREAEKAGWAGFFVWDHMMMGALPIADPWVALTAIALATERVRLGPMVTPLPRRRPTKLARETTTLDRLSGGRLILGVGIGSGPWEYEYLGEQGDPKVRGEMLDEGLAVLTGLWSGQPFSFDGKHYSIHGTPGTERSEQPGEARFFPPSLQQPRIPVWVSGMWPNKPPFRRAARWDGVYPIKRGEMFEMIAPEELRACLAFTLVHRTNADPLEVVISGQSEADGAVWPRGAVADYAAAGATWWLEDITPWRFGWESGPWPVEAMRERVRQGPPRV